MRSMSETKTVSHPALDWSKQPHVVALFHRIVPSAIVGGEDKDVFQWHDNVGTPYSPEFDSVEDAFAWPKHSGLSPQ